MAVSPPDSAPTRAAGRPATRTGASRRTRVLHVLTHLDPGGAQDNTLLSIEGTDRSRFEVDLAAGPGTLTARASAVADRTVLLRSLSRALISPSDALVFLQLVRLTRGYDVVHTHGSKAGVLGRLAARITRTPLIVHTIHGFPVTPQDGRVRRQLLLAVERLASTCSDMVVCVCERNTVEAMNLGIAAPRQLRVVVSGVSTDGIRAPGSDARGALGIPASAPVLGTITRFMPQKAPLDFIAAARTVLSELPTAHVLVVGDGPLRAAVESAAEGEKRIHVLGRRDDIPELLAAMDVVAFSSLWEGLGRALTEAVVAGRPVVATAVNGVPDLVVDGMNGYLCEPGRPDELAARVIDILRLPDRGSAMGEAGAARVGRSFDVAAMVDGLEQLYQQATLRRERRRR